MISLQFINRPINRPISAYYPDLSVQLQEEESVVLQESQTRQAVPGLLSCAC